MTKKREIETRDLSESKPQKPAPKAHPAKETPTSELFDPVICKTLKRGGIQTVESLKALSDGEILAIPGIDGTRFLRILNTLGRKPETAED